MLRRQKLAALAAARAERSSAEPEAEPLPGGGDDEAGLLRPTAAAHVRYASPLETVQHAQDGRLVDILDATHVAAGSSSPGAAEAPAGAGEMDTDAPSSSAGPAEAQRPDGEARRATATGVDGVEADRLPDLGPSSSPQRAAPMADAVTAPSAGAGAGTASDGAVVGSPRDTFAVPRTRTSLMSPERLPRPHRGPAHTADVLPGSQRSPARASLPHYLAATRQSLAGLSPARMDGPSSPRSLSPSLALVHRRYVPAAA